MSIPKDPRQLLINLMYIVLTALLALNVSAEILNAFMTMDHSLNESSELVSRSNQQLLAAINTQADAYSQYDPLRQKAAETQTISREFYDYVDQLKETLIDASGGRDEHQLPKNIKDKDTPTRMLIEEGRGDELEQKIKTVREQLLGLIDDPATRNQLAASIPLDIIPLPEDTDKHSWAQFNFQQMPIAAILPLLSKFQNDVKTSETTILNYFLGQTDNATIKPDAFEAVVAADKSYVIRGEELSAEIFLGSYSSTADNIAVSVDGRSYPVRNGKAIFKTRPAGIGNKQFEAMIKVTDPISGKEETYRKQFRYEVGERSVAVSAEKMNVFYVGVDNPVAISAAGVPSGEVEVRAEGLVISKTANGKYIARPQRPGNAKIVVSGGGLNPTTFQYRVKRIPNPVPRLGSKDGGQISAGEFKIYNKILSVLENFDFDARCNISSFELTRAPRNNDPLTVKNTSGNFSGETLRLVSRANRGDVYYFENIRVKCPGDSVTRKLNSMVFRIR